MKKDYTLAEQRQIAIGATRSYMRQMGIDPRARSADQAWESLDEIATTKPTLIASEWAVEAYRRYEIGQTNQIDLFSREWNRYCRTGSQV